MIPTMFARTVLGLGLVAIPSLAAASPFVTLPREDATTHGGVELSIVPFSSGFDTTVFRLDPYGEYAVSPTVSFFGNLPIAYATGSGGDSGVGALVVGAAYAPVLSPGAKVVFSAALGLPTASENLAVILSNYARVTDVVQGAPNTVTPRFNAQASLRSNKLIAQGGLGVDIAIPTDDGDNTTLVRLGGGIGYDLGAAVIGGELSLLFITDEPDDDYPLVNSALSVRGTTGNLSPYGALILPLSNIRDVLSFAITVGMEYRP